MPSADEHKIVIQRIQTPGPVDLDQMGTEQLRDSFLIPGVFERGASKFFLTDLDRLVVGGISPVRDFALPGLAELGRGAFLARREAGIINLGDCGRIRVGADTFELDHLECLYIGQGESDVVFHPAESGLARYYMLSCPAHARHPNRKASLADARVLETGTMKAGSRRKIFQYIYPGGLASSQLVMGFTQLEEGSTWNTMPAHTHERRTEIYFYFDLGENILVHLLGEPSRTKHVIVHDGEAVLSPAWSLHSGAGTSSYRFVWGMAGENQEFDDMDHVTFRELA